LCFQSINFYEKKILFLSIKEFCTTDRIGIKNERIEMDAEGIISTMLKYARLGGNVMAEGMECAKNMKQTCVDRT
jgi:hypothetical protein